MMDLLWKGGSCTPLGPQGLIPQMQQTTGVKGTGVQIALITLTKNDMTPNTLPRQEYRCRVGIWG